MKSNENIKPAIDAQKVLIADDDEATRILLRMALTQWGYRVVEACDGEEAWELLQQPNPPEILTLDWLMPKLDGISLCKRIGKELHFRPYIIFLTRMSGTESVTQGLEAGADEFILKPFDLTELRIRIFAGERIIKYRRLLAERDKQLQACLAKIKTLTDEKTDQALSEQKTRDKQLPEKIYTVPAEPITQEGESMINMQRMRDFFGNNSAAIQDFIKTFISLSSGQIKEIENAIKNKDSKSAKYFFHLLGSASGNSGIMKMYEVCGKGEEKVSQLNWEAASACHHDLEIMIEKLQAELAGELKK